LSLQRVETKTLLAFFLPPLVKISSVSQRLITAADKIFNHFLILSVVVKAVAKITHWHSPKKIIRIIRMFSSNSLALHLQTFRCSLGNLHVFLLIPSDHLILISLITCDKRFLAILGKYRYVVFSINWAFLEYINEFLIPSKEKLERIPLSPVYKIYCQFNYFRCCNIIQCKIEIL